MQLFFIQIIIFISLFYSTILSPIKDIPDYLSSNIIEDISKLLFTLSEGVTVPFNNSLINVTLYNTSDESFSYEKMNINFENCLTILQKVYDLDPFFDYTNNDSNEIYKRCFFIIIKIEIDRRLYKDNKFLINNNISNGLANNHLSSLAKNNSVLKKPTNHIEYLIFNGKNGKLLNTSYCNDLNVKISHPIIKQDIIDLNTSKKFYEQYQIDVFRTNDSFFNDICTNYTSDKNKDMTLNQRRQYFFQNVSFCDSNCTYIEVNYTSNTAVCACEVKGVMNDKLLYEENNEKEKSFTYNDIISAINYKLFTCYKQVFDSKRLLKNVGNYFSFFLIILYTMCIIHFYKNRKLNIMSYYQKIKSKIKSENAKSDNSNNDNKSNIKKNINSNDSSNNDKLINKKISNHESNKEIISYNSDEDKKEESNNKSIDEININEISIKDIAANPPLKKGKLKLKINSKETQNKINNMKKYILNINNSATKDTYNYGEIKIDTADELIDAKNINNDENMERNWNEIITLKKKPLKKSRISTNSILSSTKQNSTKSNMKKSSDLSNSNKTNNSIKEEYINDNNYNYIFPSNNGVEIPIKNIVPSFLQSKNNLINVNNINIQNININSRNLRNSLRLSSLYNSKDLSSSQNSQNIFIYKKSKTKSTNAMHNNFISKHDHDIISEREDENNLKNNNNLKMNRKGINNVHNSTLRRTREIEISKKRTKNKKKEGKNKVKNFFEDFDEMKFEIAILIDNRNFCEKLICELKEKCIVIFLLFRKDVIFKQIELSLFILSCTLDYFFNAFLYSDVYLEKEYEQENLIKIFIDYPKEIFSSMASQFIVKLIQLLIEEHAISLFVKRVAMENKNYLKAINFLLRKYEKRFFIYIFIGYFFLLVTWYFTSAFCTVYQNTQLNLLYDTLESLALNIFLPLPLSFLSIVFRHLAILKLNKFLFFVSNMFRIFA